MSAPDRGSKPALAILRVAAAAALLVWAVTAALEGSPADAWPTLRAAWIGGAGPILGWGALACAVFGSSFAVAAWRFQVLLSGGGLFLPYAALLRATVVASFFNVVVPGGIAGDAYRVWDVRGDTGQGSEALGLVALERVLSLAALGALALLAIPFVPLAPEREALRPALLALAGFTAASAAVVLLPGLNRLARTAISRLTGGDGVTGWLRSLGARADRALAAVAELHRKPGRIALALGLSWVCQGLPVLAVFALSGALDTEVSFAWYGVIVPFVTLATLAPVSVGGLGVRELLYVELFGSVGMRPEVALSLSLFVFAASLVWAAIGFTIFAWGRPEHE